MRGENNNYPAFYDAETIIRNLGHQAINPARIDPSEDASESLARSIASIANTPNGFGYYLHRDINKLMEADAICVLPGWQESREAKIEVDIAESISLPVLTIKENILIPRIEAIGLSGYARSGKNIVGNYLESQGWEQVAFADQIRNALYTFNPRVGYDSRVKDIVDAHDWETGKIVSPEIRVLLQRLGTDVGRKLIGEDVWIDLTLKNIPDGSRVVFTDCRFPNEADKVRQFGGKIWRINRPEWSAVNDHESETALDEYRFDRVFVNDSSIKELDYKVELALREDGLK